MSDEYLRHLGQSSSLMSETLAGKLSAPREEKTIDKLHLIISNAECVIESSMVRRVSCSDAEVEISFAVGLARMTETQKFYGSNASVTCGDLALDDLTCAFWGYDFISDSVALITMRFLKQEAE